MTDIQVKNRKLCCDWLKLGVQGDNNVETVRFILPRWHEGIDLYEGIAIVMFALEDGTTGYSNLLEENKTVVDDVLFLNWMVGQEITEKPGRLAIAIKISGLDMQIWNSEPAQCTVSKTIQVKSPQPVMLFSKSSSKARMADPNLEPPITVLERTITIPGELQNIAVQNDQNSEEVTLICPRYFDGHDLFKYTFLLRTVNSEDGFDAVALFPTASATELKMVWTLKPPQTSFPGKLAIQLWVTGENFDWHTAETTVNIIREIAGEPIIPVTPPAMDEFLREIAKLANIAKSSAESAKESEKNAAASADAALEASKNYPIVNDETGYWMVWDVEQNKYVQTNTQASAMYATFEINVETGILTMYTKDGYKGADFAINNGCLEVII